MKQNKKMLIEQGNVSELSAIFNQHYDNSSEKGFTEPLNEEEESLVIKQLLKTGSLEWQIFVSEYIQHYPLSNSAELLLVKNVLDSKMATTLLLSSIEKYGSSPVQAEKICSLFLDKRQIIPEILEAICQSSRVNSDMVAKYLMSLETRYREVHPSDPFPDYVERYKNNIIKYRSSR